MVLFLVFLCFAGMLYAPADGLGNKKGEQRAEFRFNPRTYQHVSAEQGNFLRSVERKTNQWLQRTARQRAEACQVQHLDEIVRSFWKEILAQDELSKLTEEFESLMFLNPIIPVAHDWNTVIDDIIREISQRISDGDAGMPVPVQRTPVKHPKHAPAPQGVLQPQPVRHPKPAPAQPKLVLQPHMDVRKTENAVQAARALKRAIV
jgi:hypothetical protein